jgi:tetratricopeptide (TPR) repeat protein
VPLYKRALDIDERALGPNHPDVATILNNLAGIYEKTGRSREAQDLRERAAKIRGGFGKD